MSLGLIGWGRFLVYDAKGNVVGRSTVPYGLYQYVHANAKEIAGIFNVFQWPPIAKAQGGKGPGCDGYGLYDPYDLGTKPQQGSIDTQYGMWEDGLAAIAALRSYGCVSSGDLVMHQRSGENGGPGVFNTLGADHKTHNGAGNAVPGYFRGNTNDNNPIPPFRPSDAVPVPADDFPFGRELVYQNCDPAGATQAAAIAYVRWLMKRTSFGQFRFDDTKGTYAPAVAAIMNAFPGIPFYSEFFDGNPATLDWWANEWPMNGRSGVEDFTAHWRMQAACNGYDATQFFQGGIAGYCDWRPDLDVTFADNPDTDTSPGQQIISNKGHAYAFMLGLPCRMALVYGKDYFPTTVWPGSYGLKPIIDNQAWIARMFAFGAYKKRWADKDVWAYTRDGNGGAVGWSGGLLMAGNLNTGTQRTVTLQTTWAPGRWVHDYSAGGGATARDFTVDGNGCVTITFDPNTNSKGVSWVGLAPGGVTQPLAMNTLETTHTFVGDPTLDVMPVTNGVQTMPQRIFAKAGTRIKLDMIFDRGGLAPTAGVALQLLTPEGALLGIDNSGGSASVGFEVKARATGFHTIQTVGSQIIQPSNFELAATYTGA